jgi:CubicO group peptidase (beta-lactamase class C family)
LVAVIALAAVSLRAAEDTTLPAFTDPGRLAKLESAFPEVEKVFERYRQERGIPGLVFGIVIDRNLAYVNGVGFRSRESNEPVTPETVFHIASMTKSFTALAILKLRDEGRLSLPDPAAKWIPELSGLRYPTRDTAPITIRELMTHSAGFPEDNPWGDRQLAVSGETLTAWLRAGVPFSTPPGTEYEYSNYGFALLGRIVSRVAGMPCQEYLVAANRAVRCYTASSARNGATAQGPRVRQLPQGDDFDQFEYDKNSHGRDRRPDRHCLCGLPVG